LINIFKKYYFDVNYTENYRQSTVNFWQNVESMSSSALPSIKAKLVKVFPELANPEKADELTQRAVFLLANSFNAYLHNFNGQGLKKEYPYSAHNESVMVVTRSEKGPFDRAEAFGIQPQSTQLSRDLKLGRSLIINNRRSGRMSKYEIAALAKIYPDQKKYLNNAALVIIFKRLSEHLSKAEMEKVQSIDWSDIVLMDWQRQSDSEFYDYLNNKYRLIPAIIAQKINELRKKAIELFRPGQPATIDLLEGRIVPIWILSDPDRKTIALFPFLTKGY